MRFLFSIAFCSACLMATGQRARQKAPFHLVKLITADLDNDGKADTIRLSSNLGQTGYFNKISIVLAGCKKQTFYAKDEWTIVDKRFLDSNKNTLNSKLLFLKKTDKHAVILLFGVLDGAGYRAEFSIINIEKNTAKVVFDHSSDDGMLDVEHPVTLTDLQNNGRLCFIYRETWQYAGSSGLPEQKGIPDIGSYSPYLVYPVENTCKLDKPFTKKYNEDHYVFAGYKYSEKILVFYPRKKGRYSVWKKKIIQ
jgi:hypothetical protein